MSGGGGAGAVPTALLRRIEADVLIAAARRRVVADIGPYRTFIDPETDDPGQSFAMPVRPWCPTGWRAEVQAVSTRFRDHRRVPRVEVFDRAWPGLDERLLMAGWSTELRSVVMVRQGPATASPTGAQGRHPVRVAGADATDDDVQQFLHTTQAAFGIDTPLSTPGEVARLRADLSAGRLVIALVGDARPRVACGSLLVGAGAVGLADVGTVPDARHQGHARGLCAALLDHPAARAAPVVWLSTANGAALELYDRHLGFQPAGTHTCYRRAA